MIREVRHMPKAGYMTKTKAMEYVQEHTGYGRRAVERKIEDMEAKGLITLIPDPGHPFAKLLSDTDVEKLVAALTLP
jgi:DNA-binding MarR family transcriptional regulator